MRSLLYSGMLAVAFLASGCSSNQADRISGPTSAAARSSIPVAISPNSQLSSNQGGGSLNGAAGEMPAYYDSALFTINFKELPPEAEKQVLAHNQSINTIWMSDAGLPGEKPFVSVLDAIQGDGFNPLWREVQITFNEGFTPRQLFSDTEILAAASGDHPEITLTFTDEVYRCSVVGRKNIKW